MTEDNKSRLALITFLIIFSFGIYLSTQTHPPYTDGAQQHNCSNGVCDIREIIREP